jgi:ADP-heptose:LPS heptosyltransferase
MKKTRIAIKVESSLEAIVSTAAVVASIKANVQNVEVGLITEKFFTEATRLVPGVDFTLEEFAESEDMELIDLSNSSLYGFGTESLDWKAYLQGVSQQDHNNPYHYIDLLKRAANLDLRDANYELQSPIEEDSEYLVELKGDQNLKIAICLNSLSAEEVRACIDGLKLIQSPISIYLLGTLAQKKIVNLLLANQDTHLPIVDLTGRLSVVETAEVLRAIDICLCGPGSSALISSGFGTFSICVDQRRNPLYYPYGHGHIIIQSSGADQYPRALAGMIQDSVNFAINGNAGTIPSVEQWQSFADSMIDNYLGHLRLFITQRIETVFPNGSATTELYLRPLLFLGAEVSDITKTFFRLLWENSLNNRDIQSKELEILHHSALGDLAEYLKPLEQTFELANFGCTYSNYIAKSLSEGNIARAKHESARLQETETLLFTLGRAYPGIAALCAFHEKRQQLIPAADPIELATKMAQQFDQLKQRVIVLLDLANSLFHTSLQSERTLMGAQEEFSNG